MENLFKLVEKLVKEDDYLRAIDELNNLYKLYPGNAEILIKRGDLNYKLQNYSSALNDYNKALKIKGKKTKDIEAKIEIITNIIKYRGSDIYAATNLNNDPWLDD
ncbi:MAG: tetratricopeptide repeat protein [Thiohalospira sp.]